MLDLKALEKDPEGTKAALLRRGTVDAIDEVLAMNKERRAMIKVTEELQGKRNAATKSLKGAAKEEIDARRAELKELSTTIKGNEAKLRELEEGLRSKMLYLPNIPSSDTPDGASEDDNVEIRKILEPKSFDFEPLDHQTLGENLDGIDAVRAAKVSGARFAYLKGPLAELNRAIAHFFIQEHLAAGDTELWTPLLVNEAAMTGTNQLPKFEDDAFCVVDGDRKYYLIPTAEVSVTNYHADEILEEAELPIRYFSHTPCFRAEAGSAGRDTRGLIRQHQFEKVEMVRFATPEQEEAELKAMVDRASDLLTKLGLPHRVVELCTGDLGFGATRTFDLEVWLPSQGCYREISSCSSCGTFQARRAKIRYRPNAEAGKKAKPKPLITLNGSGLAIGRTLVAIMENYQQADGTILVPKPLISLMRGINRVAKPQKG